MTRGFGTFIACLLLTSVPAMAQEASPQTPTTPAPHRGCALHPSPDCRLFGVTDFGLAFGPTRRDTTHYPGRRRTTARTTLEGGVMYNLGPRDAIGITAFFTVGDEDVSLGTGARYRRWLTRRQSIDVGLAVPLGSSDYEGGTVLGLLRYSPTPWLGLSVRQIGRAHV